MEPSTVVIGLVFVTRRQVGRAAVSITLCLALLSACAPGQHPVPPPEARMPDGGAPDGGTFPSAESPPSFQSSIQPLTDADRAAMTGVSWEPGCPVALDDLRKVRVSRYDFARRALHNGVLVVHRRHAGGVVEVFRRLFEIRFPIPRMRLIEAYGGDDDASMAANNTSAFNCRRVTGGSAWSEHAYGWAIDINPVQNPYVNGTTVLPPAGSAYTDRSNRRPGMILAGGIVISRFAEIGWDWGGAWTSPRDYQHFSDTGR